MMMKQSSPVSGFELPELAADNKINRVLAAALQSRDLSDAPVFEESPIYWGEAYFGLDRVSISLAP